MDLVCLVADNNMRAAVDGVLGRPKALRIRPILFEVPVHPRRDPGCFHESAKLLSGYRKRTRHALVLLDAAWQGAPAESGQELEELLEVDLRRTFGDWVRAVVIDPELEAWVFSDSPHVASNLGWNGDVESLRAALSTQGLWQSGSAKPADPKGAVQWVLREARLPRSSSIYRGIAEQVSLRRCQDRAFLRLSEILRGWFAE